MPRRQCVDSEMLKHNDQPQQSALYNTRWTNKEGLANSLDSFSPTIHSLELNDGDIKTDRLVIFVYICLVFIRLSIHFPLCSPKLIEKSKLQTQVTNRLPTMTKYVRSESAVAATEDRRARLVLEREIEYHETMLAVLRKEYSKKYGYVFFLFFFTHLSFPPLFVHHHTL